MSSISSKAIIDDIVAKADKGDNRKVVEIIEYQNIFNGGLTWKLIYKGDNANYIRANLACLSQRTYWQRNQPNA